MSKLKANKKAQMLFIVSGLSLIILTVIVQIDSSLIQNWLLMVLLGANFGLYVFYMLYLGVNALVTGKYPHDRALLIFSGEQRIGLFARFSGLFLILFACYGFSMLVDFF